MRCSANAKQLAFLLTHKAVELFHARCVTGVGLHTQENIHKNVNVQIEVVESLKLRRPIRNTYTQKLRNRYLLVRDFQSQIGQGSRSHREILPQIGIKLKNNS